MGKCIKQTLEEFKCLRVKCLIQELSTGNSLDVS